eukprot:Rmarinus@m.11983
MIPRAGAFSKPTVLSTNTSSAGGIRMAIDPKRRQEIEKVFAKKSSKSAKGHEFSLSESPLLPVRLTVSLQQIKEDYEKAHPCSSTSRSRSASPSPRSGSSDSGRDSDPATPKSLVSNAAPLEAAAASVADANSLLEITQLADECSALRHRIYARLDEKLPVIVAQVKANLDLLQLSPEQRMKLEGLMQLNDNGMNVE